MNIKTFMPSKHKLVQAIALGVLTLAANQAYATAYDFSDLGTITGSYGGTDAVANAINNLGQVAGNDSHNALSGTATLRPRSTLCRVRLGLITLRPLIMRAKSPAITT